MRALDFPRLKPFTAGFFTPFDIAEQTDILDDMAPFIEYHTDAPLSRQLKEYTVPCGKGWNHDYIVGMNKRDLLEEVAFATIKSASSHLHLQGVPSGVFTLGGVLPVKGFYRRRILNLPTWLDEPYDKKVWVGRTTVADAVRDASRDMLVASGIQPEDFDKIAIVVGTDPSSARYLSDTDGAAPRLFAEAPFNNISLDIVTSLNLAVRHRFFVTLALKKTVPHTGPSSFGALLHRHDDVTNDIRNDEPILVYHCHYKHAAITPLLADIRMDLNV